MAALLRRMRLCPAIGIVHPKPCVLTDPSRRTIIPDPEVELERMNVTKSFETKSAVVRPPSVDIGLQYRKKTASRQERLEKWTQRKQLEPLARQRKLVIDLAQLERDSANECGLEHARTILEHYSLYADLFEENVHFYPVVNMRISYDFDDDTVVPVYRGNRLLAVEARSKPDVCIEDSSSSTYCLLLTSPDGHLTESNGEYLHWFVGNIPEGNLNSGSELCSYLPPIPPRGTGFHRYVFLLFKQLEEDIDFSECIKISTGSLAERSFSTAQFFRRYLGKLVPAGLNFFQCAWDDSVRDTFHNVLDMKEPAYEYDFPEPYHPQQKIYPHKQPFNLYMDRYRDRKEIREQALKARLKNSTPQSGEKQEWKYPLAVPYKRAEQPATWLELQTYNRRAKRNLWKYAYTDD